MLIVYFNIERVTLFYMNKDKVFDELRHWQHYFI